MENAKKSMVDVLNMNPSVNLMGTADLSVAYSKDFTRLVVSGQEKDLQERVLLSQDIAALLILQIMNGVSCDDAQAALESPRTLHPAEETPPTELPLSLQTVHQNP